MHSAKDIRARVRLLIPADISLVQFTGSFTCVSRRIESLGLNCRADTFALAVCVDVASKLPALTDIQRAVLTVFPDADLKHLADVSHEDAILRMSTDGYVKATNPVDNVLLLHMQSYRPPSTMCMDFVVGHLYNRFRDVPKHRIRNIAAGFNYHLLLTGKVISENCPQLGTLKKHRRQEVLPFDEAPPALLSQLEALESYCRITLPAVPALCSVCLDVSPNPVLCSDCTCGSVVCTQCLEKYVCMELYTSQVATRRCVRPGCLGSYGDANLEQALGLHYRKFMQLETTHALGSVTHTCVCGCIVSVDGDLPRTVTCPSCRYVSCTACGESGVGHHECVSAEARKKARLADAMTEAVIRQCECGSRFVKEDGCNKMTCPCGKKMCYICRAVITSYAHFCSCGKNDSCARCHIYTDATRRDEAALAALITAYKEET